MSRRTCFDCGSDIGADMQAVDVFDSVEYYCGDCSENAGESE